jgi:hypothetical protein
MLNLSFYFPKYPCTLLDIAIEYKYKQQGTQQTRKYILVHEICRKDRNTHKSNRIRSKLFPNSSNLVGAGMRPLGSPRYPPPLGMDTKVEKHFLPYSITT